MALSGFETIYLLESIGVLFPERLFKSPQIGQALMPSPTCYTLANLTCMMTTLSLLSALTSLFVPLLSMVGHVIVVISSSLTLLLPICSKCHSTTANVAAVALE
jgi:hypothetical protein